MIFDYRGFGDSDGQPRSLVSLERQLEDYKVVIIWARQRPEQFLNDKFVVLGTALSGLYVSQLALEDPGLAGVMAQCPILDGTTCSSNILRSLKNQSSLRIHDVNVDGIQPSSYFLGSS